MSCVLKITTERTSFRCGSKLLKAGAQIKKVHFLVDSVRNLGIKISNPRALAKP